MVNQVWMALKAMPVYQAEMEPKETPVFQVSRALKEIEV